MYIKPTSLKQLGLSFAVNGCLATPGAGITEALAALLHRFTIFGALSNRGLGWNRDSGSCLAYAQDVVSGGCFTWRSTKFRTCGFTVSVISSWHRPREIQVAAADCTEQATVAVWEHMISFSRARRNVSCPATMFIHVCFLCDVIHVPTW